MGHQQEIGAVCCDQFQISVQAVFPMVNPMDDGNFDEIAIRYDNRWPGRTLHKEYSFVFAKIYFCKIHFLFNRVYGSAYIP